MKRTLLVVTGLIATLLYILRRPFFGVNPAAARLARIKKSPNYQDEAFQNPEPTFVTRQDASYRAMIRDYFTKPQDSIPAKPLPCVRTDLKTLSDEKPTLVWFGHSSYLIKSKGVTILLDPVFSGNASPVPYASKAFPGTDVYGSVDMPAIDFLLLSHDHYDHLDYQTIRQLIPKVSTFCTPLGVGAHLERWGVASCRIIEFDWWEQQSIATDIDLRATPARHFSGRSYQRGKTLWTSYVLNLHGYTLFLGGDSGYGQHIQEIGNQFGPFDLAILECGQYGKDWPNIHMFPEEVVTAAQALGAKMVLPVHWAKFALSMHSWNEPIRRLLLKAQQEKVSVTTPRIGEPVVVNTHYPISIWWDK